MLSSVYFHVHTQQFIFLQQPKFINILSVSYFNYKVHFHSKFQLFQDKLYFNTYKHAKYVIKMVNYCNSTYGFVQKDFFTFSTINAQTTWIYMDLVHHNYTHYNHNHSLILPLIIFEYNSSSNLTYLEFW